MGILGRRRTPAPLLAVIEASGRFDTDPDLFEAAWDDYAELSDVQVWTEVGAPRVKKALRAWCERTSWTLIQHDKVHGMDECAILVRPGLPADRDWAKQLSPLRVRPKRAPFNAVSTRIKHPDGGCAVRLFGSHQPAHVEQGGPGVLRPGRLSRVYRAVTKGLRALVLKAIAGGVIVAADWNLHHGNAEVREWLDHQYPGTRTGYDPDNLPDEGTLGNRLIDGTRSNLEIAEHTEVLARRRGFDHKHTRTVYRLRKQRRRTRPADLRILDLNTHVGWSIRNGTLAELISRTNPHILLLQELKPARLKALRKLLGNGWIIRGEWDTVVCVRNQRRFTVEESWSPDNTHGEQYTRHATGMRIHDSKTDRDVLVQSIHCQPLGEGLAGGNMRAVARQTKQLVTYRDRSADAPAGAVVVDGGDVNQRQGQRVPKDRQWRTVEALWADAGMGPAHEITGDEPASLDVFLVRPDDYVDVVRHAILPTWRNTDDHPGVLLSLKVTPQS